jgi:outer membrane immunogenic protein
MKKLLLSIAITAGMAGSAIAADIPVKSRPMAPPVVVTTNWTGCYIAAGGGYGMWNQEIATVVGATGVTSEDVTVGGRGWFGTVQGGCDYQFSDRWLIGVFADFDWSGLKGTMTWPRGAATVAPGTILGDERHRWSWAVGGRIGYLVVPQLLAYVSAGYTQARFDDINTFFAFGAVPGTTFLPATTYSGWFIGSGYEYAIDFLPGLFWKTEYRYSSFRTEELPFLFVATGAPQGDFIRSEKYIQTIRTELVWRFNWSGPVVARY